MRATSTDGTELAIYESGTHSGPTVVAVHGYPDDHTVWDGVAAELAGRFRVVTYDVRGAGASAAPDRGDGYGIDRLVDDLVAVLVAVAPSGTVHLVGHDWGSVQAWPALDDPRLAGRIASFTSVSGPSLDHAGVWFRDARAHPRPALRQLAHSYYTLLFQLPGVPEAAIRAGLIERTIGRRSKRDQRNGLNLYRANMRRAARPRPGQIGVPVQVLAPARDRYVSAAFAKQAPRPFVADLRVRDLAGGHWVVRQRPEVVARCIAEFAEHIDGAPESPALGRARRRGSDGTRRHAGRLVFITGAAHGIGRATATAFARAGADIVLADIDEVAAKQAAAELSAHDVETAAYRLDVADADAWDDVAELVCAAHGVPDVVINNAGIGMAGPFLDTEAADWQRVLGVNLGGVLHGSRVFGRRLVARGEGGTIVNIASAAAFVPSRTLPAYATTKAAVLMATQCLRAELAGQDIGVSAICPGFVDSDITTTTTYVGADAETQQRKRDRAKAAYQRRNYRPERVAEQIVRAVERNSPVVAVTAEAKILREIDRFAPALARQLSKIDLAELG